MFRDSQSLFSSLQRAFKSGSTVFFNGSYTIAADPLVTDKERVQMTTHEIWKVTSYRFWYEYVCTMRLLH